MLWIRPWSSCQLISRIINKDRPCPLWINIYHHPCKNKGSCVKCTIYSCGLLLPETYQQEPMRQRDEWPKGLNVMSSSSSSSLSWVHSLNMGIIGFNWGPHSHYLERSGHYIIIFIIWPGDTIWDQTRRYNPVSVSLWLLPGPDGWMIIDRGLIEDGV